MLGKLIKHEWKSVYKIGCIILGAIAVVTLIGSIILQTPLVYEISESNAPGFVTAMMLMTSLLLYVLLLVGAVYGILIYMGVHFYKTMYTDEGYLTHTLPVTPNQLMISKTLVSGIWMLLIECAVFASVVVLVVSLVIGVMRGEEVVFSFRDLWENIIKELRWARGNGLNINFQEIHTWVSCLLAVLISPFASMLMIFGALSIGQLSKKYKVMMGILAYIGLLIVNSMVSSLIRLLVSVSALRHMDESYIAMSYDTNIGISLVMSLILYLLSYFIISRKLNME